MDKPYWPPGSLPQEGFSWKNFLRSKGAKGLESIFKYVPESMKVSFLKGMHKMHPMQAEEFMRKMFWDDTTSAGWDEWVKDTTRHLWAQDEGLNKTYGRWQGPPQKPSNVIQLKDTPAAEIRRLFPKMPGDYWKQLAAHSATDEAKYLDALMDQAMKLNPDMDAERAFMDNSIRYQTALTNQKNKFKDMEREKIIDFAAKKQQMAPKGIPWSNIGRKILRNPITRGIGIAGDVALGGMALADVFTGSSHVGSSVDQINRWGGLRKNVDTGRLEQNPFHGARIGAQDAQARRGVSTGGIVSLML